MKNIGRTYTKHENLSLLNRNTRELRIHDRHMDETHCDLVYDLLYTKIDITFI